MAARVSALLLEVKRELHPKPLIYNNFRSHFMAFGRWREHSAPAATGKSTAAGGRGAALPARIPASP
jgi:hypothetical protein